MLSKIEVIIRILEKIIFSSGLIFLSIESYEVLTENNVTVNFFAFLAFASLVGVLIYFIDGYLLTGGLRKSIEIKNKVFDTAIEIKCGDIFEQPGWLAISVNDFFDYKVDDVLISKSSMHGMTIDRFWRNNPKEWKRKIISALRGEAYKLENRKLGNRRRYRIGTTATLREKSKKIIFVALGVTDTRDNTTTANVEELTLAIRGLLQAARVNCANEDLHIPLIGAGLSRVGMDQRFLLDLIISMIFYESKLSKVTNKVVIVLTSEITHSVNLLDIQKRWS